MVVRRKVEGRVQASLFSMDRSVAWPTNQRFYIHTLVKTPISTPELFTLTSPCVGNTVSTEDTKIYTHRTPNFISIDRYLVHSRSSSARAILKKLIAYTRSCPEHDRSQPSRYLLKWVRVAVVVHAGNASMGHRQSTRFLRASQRISIATRTHKIKNA
jgi:hypothetical protein